MFNAALENQATINEQLIELLGHAGIIDDSTVTTISTFSSSKIMNEINLIVGNINSVLDSINGEVI